MKELIEAAKDVIAAWDDPDAPHIMRVDDLRAAVEQAEKPPDGFNGWLSTHNAAYPADEWIEFGRDAYGAAQQAERERIKEIIGGLIEHDPWIHSSTLLKRIDDLS